jgi:hypothetical protein
VVIDTGKEQQQVCWMSSQAEQSDDTKIEEDKMEKV